MPSVFRSLPFKTLNNEQTFQKMSDLGFCYRWYDSSNGKFYVGSHKGTPDDSYLGSGLLFKRAYKKRPECFSREILYFGEHYKLFEQTILDYEDAANSKNFYNLKNAAEGGATWNGRKMSVEGRKNISESKKGSKNPMYGKKLTKQHIDKLSKCKRGANNPSSIKVYCKHLNKNFETLQDAANELGLSKGHCSKMINGLKPNKYGLRKIQKI